jgi:hypothetical protein
MSLSDPLTQAKSHVGICYVNHRRKGGGTPIETYFHRSEFEGYFFIEGLIGFHGTHRTESCITASLRKTFRERKQQECVNNNETPFHSEGFE